MNEMNLFLFRLIKTLMTAVVVVGSFVARFLKTVRQKKKKKKSDKGDRTVCGMSNLSFFFDEYSEVQFISNKYDTNVSNN